MAVRLRCEATNFYEDEFKIEIEDVDYVGSVVEFETNLKNCSFRFDGSPKDRFKVINTTEFTFDMMVVNADHETFFYDLALQQEGRFFVKVYLKDKNGGGPTYDHIFIGHLVVDEVYLENKDLAKLTITASDGLNRLTDQEFKSDTLITDVFGNDDYYYTGSDTIIEMIFKCLQGLGTIDQYPTNTFANEFLWINHRWYESNHQNTTFDPLANTRINHKAFTKRNDEGEYTTITRAKVLEYLLNHINCSIRYLWGTYIIENNNERGEDTRSYFMYDSDGTYLYANSKANWFYGTPQPLAGGKFGYIPPLKEVCVNFNYSIGSYGNIPSYWNNDNTALVPIGDVEVVSTDTGIFCSLGIQYTYFVSGGTTYADRNVRVWFGVKIKWGSYYWVTTETIDTYTDYDDGGVPTTIDIVTRTNEWSLTEGVYLLDTLKPADSLSNFVHLNWFDFSTDPLESISGVNVDDIDTLSVSLEYVRTTLNLDQVDNIDDPGVNATIDVDWNTYGFYISPYEDGERVTSADIGIKYCANFSDTNSTYINIDTRIGDSGINSDNKIEVYDGTNWVASGQLWGVSTKAGTQKIQELLLNEIINGQPYTLRRYNGTFRNLRDPRYFIKYDSATFVPYQFDYNLFASDWRGEFLQHAISTESITVTSGVVQANTSGTLSTTGLSDSGESSATTETIYPFYFEGDGTVNVDFGDIPLPTKSELTLGQVNYLITIFVGNVRAWYLDTGVLGYDINNASNRLEFSRVVRTGEIVRGHIRKLSQ